MCYWSGGRHAPSTSGHAPGSPSSSSSCAFTCAAAMRRAKRTCSECEAFHATTCAQGSLVVNVMPCHIREWLGKWEGEMVRRM